MGAQKRYLVERGYETIGEADALSNPRGLLSLGEPRTVTDLICYALYDTHFHNEKFSWREGYRKAVQEIWAVPKSIAGLDVARLYDTQIRVVDRWAK